MTEGARRSRQNDADGALDDVPDLDLPFSQQKTKTAKPAAPPQSGARLAPPPPSSSSPYGGDLDLDGDDMVIDRNVMPDVAPRATPQKNQPIALERIELGATVAPDMRIAPGPHAKVAPRRFDPTLVVNAIVVGVVASGAGAALWHFAHRAAGWKVIALAPAAFDGGSALWSGATSLGALAGFVALAIMGMYARPRSYGYLFASLGMLVAAVAMITVTFSVGPDGAPDAPPDGALLVPWALPIVPLGIALRALWNAWDRCDEGRAGERARGALLAIAAAGIAFAAVELAFGAGVARFF